MNRIAVMLDDDTLKKLKEKATSIGLPMSAYVRLVLIEAMKDKEGDK